MKLRVSNNRTGVKLRDLALEEGYDKMTMYQRFDT